MPIQKFLCDEMLQRLGRWLRAAGYDTRIATDAKPDYYLLRQAIDEQRLFITRDREISQHRRAKGNMILLEGDTLEACAEQLSRQIGINWQFAPFSRCMICNTLLQDATPQQIANLPPQVKQSIDVAYYCPECRQVFWEGSHVRRMRDHLKRWQHDYGRLSVLA